MPRKQPISNIRLLKTFPTKKEALEFMKEEREKFSEADLRVRFDLSKDIGTGRWKVTRQDF